MNQYTKDANETGRKQGRQDRDKEVGEVIDRFNDRLIKEISCIPPELRNQAVKTQMYHIIPKFIDEELKQKLGIK